MTDFGGYMGTPRKVKFAAGRNIAMKVPPHEWEATIEFYRDVVGMKIIEQSQAVPTSICFDFGENRLWIDRVDGLSQAEVWLELKADDLRKAAGHLGSAGVVRRDEIEKLPEGFEGFWIQNPASIIHLVTKNGS
jgi:catechol 2,3-dioxygenase-like lactoylglutathione lyase family enzyme